MDRNRQKCRALWLALRHRWADGTTHLKFDPAELLERLAALTPRPRINLILYYGIPAPRAAWRSDVIQHAPSRHLHERTARQPATPEGDRTGAGPRRPGALLWAELMRRTFGFDVLACSRCGGRLRLVALIEQASVIQRILGHLGLPTEIPEPHPARAPPSRVQVADLRWDDEVTTLDAGS